MGVREFGSSIAPAQPRPSARNLKGGAEDRKWRSRPVSRVLSWTVIPLGPASLQGSSNLPGGVAGHDIASLFGLAPDGVCRPGWLPSSWCALTAPFHPYLCLALRGMRGHRRFALCCTFRRLTPPRRYLASHPVEPGLSSTCTMARRDCLADSAAVIFARNARVQPPPYRAFRGAPVNSAANLAAVDGGRCSTSLA